MRTAKVTESLGLTIKIADYEMARVDVSVEVIANHDDDTTDSLHQEARIQVRQELWESIQPFIGGWSEQRKSDLAQRLGVPLPIQDDEADAWRKLEL